MDRFGVIRHRRVFHVGSLDPTQKRRNSYEGAGLSVSLHPDTWRTIGKGLVCGSTWQLEKPVARFLDAYSVKGSFAKNVMLWAQEAGYIDRVDLWQTTWIDAETGRKTHSLFTNREDAKEEAYETDGDVRRVPGMGATEKLRLATMNDCQPGMVEPMVLTVYAEHLGFDGVWWNHRMDPVYLSAPCGVIIPSALHLWTRTEVEREDSLGKPVKVA